MNKIKVIKKGQNKELPIKVVEETKTTDRQLASTINSWIEEAKTNKQQSENQIRQFLFS